VVNSFLSAHFNKIMLIRLINSVDKANKIVNKVNDKLVVKVGK